ncbi:MAG: galactose-1-phosphate uridylyltransferase [candidate division Zixibacteria bacterium]|nr:galactose-1-phosphate uridylyltransferase [candidate division Zixibacteria bacterium]
MSTLRRDPVTARWVTNTDETEEGITTKDELERLASQGICPFCEGNEKYTPDEIYAIRRKETKKNEPGWEVRVIPNVSPALRLDLEVERRPELMYDMMNSVGADEIVIETPKHIANTADLEPSQISKVLTVYKNRIKDLKDDKRFRSLIIFKNYGERTAPTSLKHACSEVMALSFTPKNLKEELDGAKDYYDYKSRCIFCDIIRQELNTQKRVVSQNDKFIAITPFASRFSHEIWILPKEHSADFETLDESSIQNLGTFLKEILTRIKVLLYDPPYNYMFHLGPNKNARPDFWKTVDEDYHWHIEIMPLFTKTGGFEWGSGYYINEITPETAAKQLREAEI